MKCKDRKLEDVFVLLDELGKCINKTNDKEMKRLHKESMSLLLKLSDEIVFVLLEPIV